MTLSLFNECVQCHQPTEGAVVAIMTFERFRDRFPEYKINIEQSWKSSGVLYCNGKMLLRKENFVAAPICNACYQNPPKPLKAHFFSQDQLQHALDRAGSNNLGGG
jgi:hypothetical protein